MRGLGAGSAFRGDWAPSPPVSEARPANLRCSIVGSVRGCAETTQGSGGNRSSPISRLWAAVR